MSKIVYEVILVCLNVVIKNRMGFVLKWVEFELGIYVRFC